MKKFLTLSLFAVLYSAASYSQCTTTNATSCQCKIPGQTDCDLLPDITISWYALQNYASGPTEYSQSSSNGVDAGRLKVTGSTPNIGRGSLTVRGQDNNGVRTFICGTDTVQTSASGVFTCPNGNPIPMQLTTQRIYHKSGNTMSYWDRFTSPMTYHPQHNHIHFDDWGVFTLRVEDPSEPDPRNWSIVGNGHKLGFCLMDYGTCTYYNNHCRDNNTVYNNGTTMINGDFPNWGLGGGGYNCSPVEQGISSGYTDIYSESLDGMWINIPPGTCNGNYWIVYEVDPHNAIIEEDETNNYTAIPFTLTQQASPGNPVVSITPEGSTKICVGEARKLTATAGTSYVWSTGETSQSILVQSAGTYSVTVTNYCGTATASVNITESQVPTDPVAMVDTVCSGTTTSLFATGSDIQWYDSSGHWLASGNTYQTPVLSTNTTYFVRNETFYPGNISHVGKTDTTGGGSYSSSTNYTLFDVLYPVTLKSVKVSASGAGYRTIHLMNEIGIVVNGGTYYIPNGTSTVTLNYFIPKGKNYSLRAVSDSPNLWRSNGGVTYPYTLNDTLVITGSSAGAQYYYFFYDFEIETGAALCKSNMVQVDVPVEICTGFNDLWNLSENIQVNPNPSEGAFNVSIIMPAAAQVSLTVSDISGRVLLRQTNQANYGEYRTQLDLSEQSAGMYFLSTRIGNNTYKRTLMKQ